MLVLSEEIEFETASAEWATTVSQEPAFWLLAAHTPLPRKGLIIRAGCSTAFPVTGAAGRYSGLLTFGAGLPDISADGLDVIITLKDAGGTRELLRRHLSRSEARSPWHEVRFEVQFSGGPGCVIVECHPGPNGDSTADWLAVYELVIADAAEFTLQRARAFHAFRSSNELSVCNHTYSQPMYTPKRHARPVAAEASVLVDLVLDQLLGRPIPDFSQLLIRKLAIRRPLRILSLATGAGRVERHIVFRVDPSLVDVTLTDINAGLLASAQTALAPHVTHAAAIDVNTQEFPPGPYDVILCVSAMHHFVELERIVDRIADNLAPGGEFWSIGEYVGRTGARLWPDAYAQANAYFRNLPEKYRFNHAYNKVDEELPNHDCSIVTFESIRSDEVLPILLGRFEAEWIDIRSTISWRLFDSTYSPNYDMTNEHDCELVQSAVHKDYTFQQRGGKPVSMNGVFLPRR